MTTGTAEPGRPDGALYRAVGRWHFYAGLLCLPVLVLMAVTEALYLFNHESSASREAPSPGGWWATTAWLFALAAVSLGALWRLERMQPLTPVSGAA